MKFLKALSIIILNSLPISSFSQQCLGLYDSICDSSKSQILIHKIRLQKAFLQIQSDPNFHTSINDFLNDDLEINYNRNSRKSFNVDKFIKNLKIKRITTCTELSNYLYYIDKDYASITDTICNLIEAEIFLEILPQSNIRKADTILRSLKKMYYPYIKNKKLLQRIELVFDAKPNIFTNSLRSWFQICNSRIKTTSPKICDRHTDFMTDYKYADQQHILIGAKAHLPIHMLTFGIAHEIAHLILDKDPNFMREVIQERIKNSTTIKSIIKSQEDSQKLIQEISCDIIAGEVLKANNVFLRNFGGYFCNLNSSLLPVSEFYKNKSKVNYPHAKHRLEEFVCPSKQNEK